MERTTKVCRKCLVELPISSFRLLDKVRRHWSYICRECHKAALRFRYATDAAYRESKLYVKKVNYRETWLRSEYGISVAEYDAIFLRQGCKCGLCGAQEHGRTGKSGRHSGIRLWKPEHWPVDHDHETGKVRGILCHTCNTRIGAFERLRDSVGYARVFAYLDQQEGELNVEQGATQDARAA